MWWCDLAAWLYAIAFSCVLVHEAGRVCAALLLRLPLNLVQIGSGPGFVLRGRKGCGKKACKGGVLEENEDGEGISLRVGVFPWGGCTQVRLDECVAGEGFVRRSTIFLLAGAAANLAVVLVALCLLKGFWAWALVWAQAACGIAVLIPLGPSDGAKVVHVIRNR